MNNLISFPNYSPFEIQQLRPCSDNDTFSSYHEERWSLLDLMSDTLTDSRGSPSSLTIGGGRQNQNQNQNQNLQQVLPVGGELMAFKESVSSEAESVNGNSVGNVVKPLTVEEGAITAVTSPVVVKAFGQRSSAFRGVTKHRWTGRYEAHLWDNTCRVEGQKRKGRQVYLGGYDNEEKAAKAYDLAALKYWGSSATTNFPVGNYSKEMEIMKNMTQPEFIASIRRNSSGFSRGASIYRGVTRHHQQGRWQARIGRVAGNKDLYLGTFTTEAEAAEAYDIAAIKFRGPNAVTNFELSRYNVEAIAKNELPVGASTKRRTKTAILEPNDSNFEVNQCNMQALAAAKQLDTAPTKRMKHAFHGNNNKNNYNLTQLAITSSNAAVANFDFSRYNLEAFTNSEQQMVIFEKETKPQVSTMTTGSIDNNSVSLAYYGFAETIIDPCGQGMYWFGGNEQYSTSQINQLTLGASQ